MSTPSFYDIANGNDANNIGNYILNAIKQYPKDKENIRKLLLPLYEEFITWDKANCRDHSLEEKVRIALKSLV